VEIVLHLFNVFEIVLVMDYPLVVVHPLHRHSLAMEDLVVHLLRIPAPMKINNNLLINLLL
jgi:hypothetical protein